MTITFENIEKKYNDLVAVHNFSLTIQNDSLHFLLGPSGCGKTTLLRLLAGLEKPTNGRILHNGQDITKLSASERQMGMVFQNYALWPHMTVFENIEYGLKIRKMKKAAIRARVDEVLETTQMTRFADRWPGQLSGGQQQRVALARALAIRPNVLLLDEPLSNLDAKLRLEMRENISRIFQKTGITMVYVTHDQKEALSMATMISVMYSGHLMQTGSPRELYHHPKTPFIAAFIGETNLIKAKVHEIQPNFYVAACPLGLVKARTPTFSKPQLGAEVVLSLRPESINLLRTDGEKLEKYAPNYFELTLSRVTYLGDSEQLELSVSDGTVLKANLFHEKERKWSSGEKLRIGIDPADVIILPKEELGMRT